MYTYMLNINSKKYEIVLQRGWVETSMERAAVAAVEEKHSSDEGLEVHEVLPDLVEGNQDAYAEAAQQSMEAAQVVNNRKLELLVRT
jgi:hypothetical protein